MFFFGKKNKKEAALTEEIEEMIVDNELDLDDEVDVVSEDEIMSILDKADDVTECDEDDDEETDDASEEMETKSTDASVVKVISSIDELTDFLSGKKIGVIQYMRKATHEVFELREVHLRIARVWSTVSMSRECSPVEYAKIMLASEILESPELFYVLPGLTDGERADAIMSFCEDRYGINGKKYVKNADKFARLVKENDDVDEWIAYTKQSLAEKVSDFCTEKGIEFDAKEEAEENK